MMKISAILGTAFSIAIIPISVQAQIPRTISYQGVLADTVSGKARDGQFDFAFRFFDSALGGNEIWSSVTETLQVTKGLFSTILGPFGPEVPFDKPYWLEVEVAGEVLSPRVPLTSVGYSLSAARADTAMVSVASLADTTWRRTGANIYRLDGNIGIGTSNPTSRLQIAGGPQWTSDSWQKSLKLNNASAIQFDAASELKFGIGASRSGNNLYLFTTTTESNDAPASYRMVLNADGDVGIGTTSPNEKLDIQNGGLRVINTQIRDNEINRYGDDALLIQHRNAATDGFPAGNTVINANGGNVGIGTGSPSSKLHVVGNQVRVDGIATNGEAAMDVNNTGNGHTAIFRGLGNVGIGTTNPTAKLEVAGRTKTQVLEITGGADLAEPFEVSGKQPIPKGALVIIDEENPGRLKMSHQAYDTRVAGVISGAGGIKPGLTLTQEGVLEGGQNVALSGRVYALATAANGAIKPGDLLTTSDIPGHAMKATDKERWPGAVIGKAMSSLEKGEGLVLVLVNSL